MIVERADAEKEHMGLTTWEAAPDGKIVKADVSISKRIVDEAVSALLAGNLDYNPDVYCDHHNHEHGEGGHTCGEHGCGSHHRAGYPFYGKWRYK